MTLLIASYTHISFYCATLLIILLGVGVVEASTESQSSPITSSQADQKSSSTTHEDQDGGGTTSESAPENDSTAVSNSLSSKSTGNEDSPGETFHSIFSSTLNF